MRVREQDQIRNPNLRKFERRVNQSLHTQGQRPDPDPDPGTKYGICKDGEAIHANQDRAVADPSRLQSLRGPPGEVGYARRRLHQALSVLRHALP